MKKSNKVLISDADAAKYDMLSPLFNKLFVEIKELSKKKPDGPLNPVKVKMVNKILTQLKEMLEGEPGAQFIDPLDEEILPTNSDAVFMLAQFQAVMSQYYNRHHCRNESSVGTRWATIENPPPRYSL